MLEDNDILHLARGTYKIYNLRRGDPGAAFASVSRMLNTLDMEVRAAIIRMSLVVLYMAGLSKGCSSFTGT